MFFDRKTGRKKNPNNIHMIKYYATVKRKEESLYTERMGFSIY